MLSNSYVGIDDIAYHLLDERCPLIQPRPFVRRRLDPSRIDPTLYDKYTGEYELGPGTVLSVTREGDSLMVRGESPDKVEIFPESETTFFFTETNQRISFESDESGNVRALRYFGEVMDVKGTRKP